ncbi:hypothetical protein [Cytophaga aurantiaca]|uniref:hypothetical protein n=1 Tax=Cytophaga aurantiaca TaxID=29530 RepID=UPI00037D8EE7|nr:hypothetical protein [Cytophaga aurantiaca]
MDEIFKIGEEGAHALLQRQMKSTFRWIFFAIGILFIFLIYVGSFKKAFIFSGGILCLFLFSFSRRKKHFEILRYQITSDRFIQFVDLENVDTFVQMARARNAARHGVKDEKEVLFDQIDKILFKNSGEIQIFSTKFDWLTNNGRITFYPEMENFDRVKQFIKERFTNIVIES